MTDLDILQASIPGHWQEVERGEYQMDDLRAERRGEWWEIRHPRSWNKGVGRTPEEAALDLRDNSRSAPGLVEEIDTILEQTPMQLREKVKSLEAKVLTLESTVAELAGVIHQFAKTGRL
jgi:hypothetical protein